MANAICFTDGPQAHEEMSGRGMENLVAQASRLCMIKLRSAHPTRLHGGRDARPDFACLAGGSTAPAPMSPGMTNLLIIHTIRRI